MLITSVIIFVLISLTSGQFTDCDKGNPRSMVIYDQIEIPATFKIGGETNSIKVYANLLEDLQSEDLISIEISKNLFGGLKFKAPCIFGQGSCTKTFGDWFLSAEDMICDLFKSMNLPCQPRIAAGNYGYELELPVDLQIIPWVFRKIVAGNYAVKIKIMRPDNSQKACLDLKLGVVIDKETQEYLKNHTPESVSR